MIALYLAPLYLLLCGYILWRMLRWLAACHDVTKKFFFRGLLVTVYVFLALSLLLGFLTPPSMLQRVLKGIGNYWLGVLLYILLTVLVADLIRLILKHVPFPKKERLFSRKGHVIVGSICLAVILAFSAAGIYGARHIVTTDYQVKISKKAGNLKELNIVLVADFHLGYSIGSSHMQRMVEKINASKPDLVVIAGDIFDNEYEALDNPERLEKILRSIKSRYGVYACYGNHDIQEKILAGFTFPRKGKKMSDPRMDTFLEKSNIHLLRDEAVEINNAFYLFGRADYERPGRGIKKRKLPKELVKGMDRKKPILVLDHEPRELKELADAGVDLDLCGHTHDGQMFPGNLVTDRMWENSCGYLKKGKMHSIVTSGIGVFGPDMRVGTKSEICRIRVKFN